MPVYSVLEVNRIAAQTTGQRKQASRTTVYSDRRRSVWACVCLTNKKKKPKQNKNQTRNKLLLSETGELHCGNIFVVCSWEVGMGSEMLLCPRSPAVSWECVLDVCVYLCSRTDFPGARWWVLYPLQFPGEDLTRSPAHPLSLRKGLRSPFLPIHTIKNTQLWFHVMVSLVSTASSWYPGDTLTCFIDSLAGRQGRKPHSRSHRRCAFFFCPNKMHCMARR